MKIIAIHQPKKPLLHWTLQLDDGSTMELAESTLVAHQLAVGDELTESDLTELQTASDEYILLDAALHFLAARPRSRQEVRRRLLRPRLGKRPPDPATVDRVLERLSELEYLSDREFAGFWVENRDQFSPRSARAMRHELAQRGVDRETLDATLDSDLDAERAMRAARQRLRSVAGLDYQAFARRLSGFLLRRGFGYDVARETVRALWLESHGGVPDDVAGAPRVEDE